MHVQRACGHCLLGGQVSQLAVHGAPVSGTLREAVAAVAEHPPPPSCAAAASNRVRQPCLPAVQAGRRLQSIHHRISADGAACRHDVRGVFVRTWDRLEETGQCAADKDLISAQQVGPLERPDCRPGTQSPCQHSSALL